jgi:ribA/ribD-fused uncharacterized protein
METLISGRVRSNVAELVSIASEDAKAEFEVKILAGQIHTKDDADRIVKAIEEVSSGGYTEEHRATFSYSDGLRITVLTPENIFKVCTSGSFRGIPLHVERKRRYFDVAERSGVSERKVEADVIDVPDLKVRFTLRHEEPLRRDFSGSPMDPASHARIMHRKSWTTADGLLRVDMSMVKTKTKQHKSFADVLKQTPGYEVEIEVLKKDAGKDEIVNSLLRHTELLVAAFQKSEFLLADSDVQRYRMELEASRTRFINPVTMERRHLLASRTNNILKDYTVTNKADGERCFLMVARDRRLVRCTRSGKAAWTGLVAIDDKHLGDIVDGEYLYDRNLFCIFDVYSYRGKKTDRLPLMTTDEDIHREPLKSRLGCAHLFVADIPKDFKVSFSRKPFRIETKLFLAGDGPAMEKAINKILDIKFEYPTDGLIFTPRSSPVAPITERKGDTWLAVYKWKPSSQNSIDFLLRFKPEETYDPLQDESVFKGTLYISRNPGSDIIYPCETLTGEYTPPQLPADLQGSTERVPSPFQPVAPKDPNAFEILLPINAKKIPLDVEKQRIEDNTIVECVRDVDAGRWYVLRTRYDKTYQYRVLGQPQFGNDIATADSIWTNIHNPVTEAMIRSVSSSPADDTFEDDLYYRDALEARDRVLRDVYSFHNKIKESLYTSTIKSGDTLLELAVGRGGDLHKWRKTKPSKVVGIDISASNLEAPRQGACVRYLNEKAKNGNEKLPPVLFIAADMTKPLMEQNNRYLRILNKEESAPTPYLEKFIGLTEFDVVSCQFALHYACESEETFRTFVGNLTRHGKSMFFGTCMDGQSVYSLLLGRPGHLFRTDSQVFGEMKKEYADGEGWREEFGKSIVVKLESFEKPVKEYLVPFEAVVAILAENGFDLVKTTKFEDHYANQNNLVFGAEHQAFSFLHRSFVFKRSDKKPVKKEEEKQEVEVPIVPAEPEEKKETKKLAKEKAPEGPEPVLFFTGNEALNANKEFSNMFEAPIQIDGITFQTVEHYFQWSKAKMFGDADVEKKIMKTPSPKSVKAYGRKVKGFKEDEWTEKKDGIMKTAVRAKFTQHPELRKKLLDTKDAPLGEANPRDKYWGIGTGADTAKAKVPSKWPGKNKLGEMLMELRKELSE